MTTAKHQVFVSSTFRDLTDERREIMQALLELGCIPAGMELFPASDDESWELIKGVIDECDYYVVVIANRYGSRGPTGQSYTEMEFDYAAEQGLPILGFIHEDPASISERHSESTPEMREALDRFRQKVRGRNCKFYKSAEDLGSKVSRALMHAIRTKPRPGWVRAGETGDPNLAERLRQQIEQLNAQLVAAVERPPHGSEDFAQGSEEFSLSYYAWWRPAGSLYAFERNSFHGSCEIAWNDIFAELGPCLMRESTESTMLAQLNPLVRALRHKHDSAVISAQQIKDREDKPVRDDAQAKGKDENDAKDENEDEIEAKDEDEDEIEAKVKTFDYKISTYSFDTIKIQLQALGLIKQSEKTKRKAGDDTVYWCLTPYGEHHLTQLRAIRRGGVQP